MKKIVAEDFVTVSNSKEWLEALAKTSTHYADFVTMGEDYFTSDNMFISVDLHVKREHYKMEGWENNKICKEGIRVRGNEIWSLAKPHSSSAVFEVMDFL